MRWLFAILVVLNIGFFLWNSSDNGGNDMARRQGLHEEQMLLAGEQRTNQSADERITEIRERGMPNISLAGGADKESTDEAIANQGVSQTNADAKEKTNSSYLEPVTPADNAETKTEPAPHCVAIGPFQSRKQTEQIAALLKKASIGYGIKGEPATVQKMRFRVYQGPYKDAAASKAQRSSLVEKGVAEHFSRKEKNGQTIISLGVFSTRNAANTLIATLEKIGEKAEIREEPTGSTASGTVYWINTANLAGTDLDKGLAKLVGKAAKTRDIHCE